MSANQPPPIAILGPTNTGKTWYAMERMLAHHSGIFGFPLRLLARENYDRAVQQKGEAAVALITGEEKIIPPKARYLLCTVEAMPQGKTADFMAIDEIQLAADPDRGHIFTDRILNARGREETLLLGAKTIRPILEKIVPDVKIHRRDRLSALTWAGQKKITRLPRRSAIVAFSASDVYGLAELIRAQRGGTAIVMGALSPRTRNAQVAMFQSGEVDYLVATDAIGMGLNMDINHVALAADQKFDGRHWRQLSASELGQIAGRAGRYTNDGTFGTTDHCPQLDSATIDAIESHDFKPLSGVYWRNSDLDFSSLEALTQSLEVKPNKIFMTRKNDADDQRALAAMMERPDIRNRATDEGRIKLLFDICQTPDYQREYTDSHFNLLAKLFSQIIGSGELDRPWVAQQIERLDDTGGDIDALMARLSHIRTWRYISQRPTWFGGGVRDSENMQKLAQTIEDSVSDRLHQALTERFVDKKTALLARRFKEDKTIMSAIKTDGTVLVEGQEIGRLSGFVFTTDGSDKNQKAAMLAAARKTLGDEISGRIKALTLSDDAALKPDAKGDIWWREAIIGRLVKGESLYRPKAEVLPSDLLETDSTKAIADRLNLFAQSFPQKQLPQIMALNDDGIKGNVGAIAYQLYEAMGILRRQKIAENVKNLTDEEKQQLKSLGIRVGVDMLYMVDALKPAQAEIKTMLHCIYHDDFPQNPPPSAERVSIEHNDSISDGYWLAAGYRRLGDLVIRVDMAERISALIRAAARQGAFEISEEMLSLGGATAVQMASVIIALGYVKSGERPADDPEKPAILAFEKKRIIAKKKNPKTNQDRSPQNKAQKKQKTPLETTPKKHAKKPKEKHIDAASPFAILAQLKGR